MILVPNHRQLLNGNRYLFLFGFFVFLGACSPKIISVPEKENPAKEPTEKAIEVDKKSSSDNSIALILPFQLDKIKNLSKSNKSDLSKADLAIDFYQGFKFALDSLASEGFNFKLKVFDSQNQETRIVNLARANSVLENSLIIGPVFPNLIKTFGEFATLDKKVFISPLAASIPSSNNANLVTINNTIDQHGWKIADFINRNYKPSDVNILLINTQKSDDEKFAAPIRRFLKSLSNSKFVIVQKPNAIAIESFLDPVKTNLVIITSSDPGFVSPIINRLNALNKVNFNIEVFGHPNWIKLQNMDIAKLQALKTRLTSSYFLNNKDASVKHFISRYRDEYNIAPTEYAIKGFDTGYYFGKLLALHGTDYVKYITEETYQGLHNKFRFKRDEKLGYINTELMLLQYQGFELRLQAP